MKQRIISIILALVIVIPILLLGGSIYKAAVIAIGTIGIVELIKAKGNGKKMPLFVKIIAIYNFIILMLTNIEVTNLSLNISFEFLILNSLSLLFPLVLYHDKDKYNIMDATFLIASNIMLSSGFIILMCLRDYNVNYLILIMLVTFSSDIFAYIVGNLIGKHKFSPSISPNKTIEGFIGGLIFSLIISVPIYITLSDYSGNIVIITLIIALLSIMSTLGDLTFSSIKRYFNIKDFGNIMPGHGGVLDRLDSMLFVLLTFYLVISFL